MQEDFENFKQIFPHFVLHLYQRKNFKVCEAKLKKKNFRSDQVISDVSSIIFLKVLQINYLKKDKFENPPRTGS